MTNIHSSFKEKKNDTSENSNRRRYGKLCQSVEKRELDEKVEVLWASNLEDGEKLFTENQDIVLVVMDACVPGDKPTSMSLVRKIREGGFTKPIIAKSSLGSYRNKLLEAGASHEAEDIFDIPSLVMELLEIK